MKDTIIQLLKFTNREGMDDLIEFLVKSDFFKVNIALPIAKVITA